MLQSLLKENYISLNIESNEYLWSSIFLLSKNVRSIINLNVTLLADK